MLLPSHPTLAWGRLVAPTRHKCTAVARERFPPLDGMALSVALHSRITQKGTRE